MKKLSVIIPMYNVEPYVERCLRSLEDQDISAPDYEIICINDGSPDNSRGVVSKLQKEYDNIILIDKHNEGVSRARNVGIDRAEGKYLLFIDPDDYVESSSFKKILEIAELKDAQVTFLGFTFLNEDGSFRTQNIHEGLNGKIYSGMEAYFVSRKEGHPDPDRMWAILFSRDFLNMNNLRFLPDVPFLEDGELISRILCLAERCVFDSSSFYKRTTRRGSATNSSLLYSDQASNGFLLAAKNLKRFQQGDFLTTEQRFFLNQPISKFSLLAFRSGLKRPYIKNYRLVRKTLRSYKIDKLDLDGVVKPYCYYAILYNCFPPAFLGKPFLKQIKSYLRSLLKSDL
ncbi:MAG TPA: glycosyltransferase [Bacteroidales bacterium]|nr:glycosyltransferase [Bacteroidales bacterium]